MLACLCSTHTNCVVREQVPVDVHVGWIVMIEECSTHECPQLDTFSDYFVERWLGDDAKITVDIWNVHSDN